MSLLRNALLLLLLLGALRPALSAEDPAEAARRQRAVLIAALIDERSSVNGPAKEALVRQGDAVVADLQMVEQQPSPKARMRLAQVLGRIGTPLAYTVLLRQSEDADVLVREAAALGMGGFAKHQGDALVAGEQGQAVAARLRAMLRDTECSVRESAALGLGSLGDLGALGDLALWRQAGGDLHTLRASNQPELGRAIQAVRNAMKDSLHALARRPQAPAALSEQMTASSGNRQLALIEASFVVGDPRLCPALNDLLTNTEASVVGLAATSLAANGDTRCLERLCVLAAKHGRGEVRAIAATTLRSLTGFDAPEGDAWTTWWQANAARVTVLLPRDELLARLHDPAETATPAMLAVFTPSDLMPLVDGALRADAPTWSLLAWRALRTDEPTRWTTTLQDHISRELDERRRVGLIGVLDELGDPAATAFFAKRLAELDVAEAERIKRYDRPPPGFVSSEQAILRLALERRGHQQH